MPELLLGEQFFCLVVCRHSFIQGKICLASVGLGGSEEEEEEDDDDVDEEELDDLLGPDLETVEEPALPPGCCAAALPLLGLGGSGGDTWEAGRCSGGRLGLMQLPFSSLVLVSCCCRPPPLPRACKEHAEGWYESTSRWVADWKAGWWWDTGTGAS